MNEFKIGDLVEFGKEPNALIPDIEGAGEILSMASDHIIVKSWIVLITRRDTEFLRNRPERALIILESQMRKITPDTIEEKSLKAKSNNMLIGEVHTDGKTLWVNSEEKCEVRINKLSKLNGMTPVNCLISKLGGLIDTTLE